MATMKSLCHTFPAYPVVLPPVAREPQQHEKQVDKIQIQG